MLFQILHGYHTFGDGSCRGLSYAVYGLSLSSEVRAKHAKSIPPIFQVGEKLGKAYVVFKKHSCSEVPT